MAMRVARRLSSRRLLSVRRAERVRLVLEPLEPRRMLDGGIAAFDLTQLDASSGGDGSLGTVFRASPVETSRAWILGGLGTSVSFAHDLDGDDYDDVILSAPLSFKSNGDEGAAIAVWGGMTRPEMAVDVLHPAETTILNGARTILATASFEPEQVLGPNGLAIGYAGTSSTGGGAAIAGNLPRPFSEFALAGFPRSITAPSSIGDVVSLDSGDVNGDGRPDLVFGTSAGRVFLIFGEAASGTAVDWNSSSVVEITPGGAAPHFTRALVAVTDFNGDATDDVVVAGPLVSGGSLKNESAFVLAGRASWSQFAWSDERQAPERLLSIWADVPGYQAVAIQPDANGDGIDELLLGAPAAVRAGVGATGRVDLVYAWRSNVVPGMLDVDDLFDSQPSYLKIFGSTSGGQFGSDVAGIGDFDGDSWSDLAVSSAAAGRVDVIRRPARLGYGSIAAEHIDFALLTYQHPTPDAQFGSLSHEPGDFDGDGLQDLVIGAPGRPYGGEAYLIYGRDDLGTLDRVGGPGPDELDGDSSSNGLLGGAGDDDLDGGPAPIDGSISIDWLLGGAGDDTLRVSQPDYTIVAGGGGFDTVVLEGSGHVVDPAVWGAWPGALDIEAIDLNGDGPNLFVLAPPEAVRDWFPTSRRLIVRRGEDDVVQPSWPWLKSSTSSIGGVAFDVWTAGTVETWVQQIPARDFGDAWGATIVSPDTYPTVVFRDGARHLIGGPRLGQLVDAEDDARFFSDAQGDDQPTDWLAPVDDEDGVQFPPRIEIDPLVGGSFDVVVTLSGATTARLDAWIDFDGDMDWTDAHDQVFASRSLVSGENVLSVQVPAGVSYVDTYARFRLSSGGGLAPTGLAPDGEVEDYEIKFLPPASRYFDDLGTVATPGARWTRDATSGLTKPVGIGDLNGDGFDDVAVAASNADGPTGFVAGAVYVLWGSAAGLASGDLDSPTGPTAMKLFGPGDWAGLGYSLAGAGDFNGDGLSDLALATAFGDSSVGRLYVVFGSRQAWPSTFDLTSLHASRGGDGARGVVFRDDPTIAIEAFSLTFVGDVNADGRDDLAFGHDFLETPAEVDVIFGRERPQPEYDLRTMAAEVGGNAALGVTIVNATDASFRGLGGAVAGVGDVNGDGIDDFAVGLPFPDGDEAPSGEVVVIFGELRVMGDPLIRVGMPDRPIIASYWKGATVRGGDYFSTLGAVVTGAGDVNGDGYDDFAATDFGGDVVLVFGASFATWGLHPILAADQWLSGAGGDGSRGVVLRDANLGDPFAIALAGGGDVNGDGFDDLLVGSGFADPSGQIDAGAAVVLFGHAAPWPAELWADDLSPLAADEGWRFAGEYAGQHVGDHVHVVGDVDGDGTSDWTAGSVGPFLSTARYYLGLGDSRAAATGRGDAGSDQLSGSSQRDVLHGLQGDDSLDGLSGPDALFGGAGDDLLAVDTQFLRVDGGSGVDTLTLRVPGPSFELRDLRGDRIRNVEILRFESESQFLTLQVDVNSVANLAPPSHRLVVSAEGSPSTLVADEGNWTFRGAALVAPADVYFLYRHGSLELWLPRFFSFWKNPLLPLDVNADGLVSPVDALIIINELNVRTITASNGAIGVPWLHPEVPLVFWDVNDDGFCAPIDALLVINQLNQQAGAEGESSGERMAAASNERGDETDATAADDATRTDDQVGRGVFREVAAESWTNAARPGMATSCVVDVPGYGNAPNVPRRRTTFAADGDLAARTGRTARELASVDAWFARSSEGELPGCRDADGT